MTGKKVPKKSNVDIANYLKAMRAVATAIENSKLDGSCRIKREVLLEVFDVAIIGVEALLSAIPKKRGKKPKKEPPFEADKIALTIYKELRPQFPDESDTTFARKLAKALEQRGKLLEHDDPTTNRNRIRRWIKKVPRVP